MKNQNAKIVQIEDRRRKNVLDLPVYKRYMTPEELEEYIQEEIKKEPATSKLKQWLAAIIMLTMTFTFISLSEYLHGGPIWIETELHATKPTLKSTIELKSYLLLSGMVE